jgi:hypothetical protein
MEVNGQFYAYRYLRGKSPRYSLDKKLVGPQSRSGRWRGFSFPCREWNPKFSVVQPVAATIPTEQSRLLHLHAYLVSSSPDEAWGFHGGESCDIGLHDYGTVSFRKWFTTFRRVFLPQSSEQKLSETGETKLHRPYLFGTVQAKQSMKHCPGRQVKEPQVRYISTLCA